jgi:hypothetical protein
MTNLFNVFKHGLFFVVISTSSLLFAGLPEEAEIKVSVRASDHSNVLNKLRGTEEIQSPRNRVVYFLDNLSLDFKKRGIYLRLRINSNDGRLESTVKFRNPDKETIEEIEKRTKCEWDVFKTDKVVSCVSKETFSYDSNLDSLEAKELYEKYFSENQKELLRKVLGKKTKKNFLSELLRFGPVETHTYEYKEYTVDHWTTQGGRTYVEISKRASILDFSKTRFRILAEVDSLDARESSGTLSKSDFALTYK